MRTAIMGAGSLGTIIGALMARGGKDIDLIDVNRQNVDALNSAGATITGFMEVNVPVRAITPDEMTGYYDLVFLLTKQTYNHEALNQLLPHLYQKSIVCTLQNGIPEESVASYVGRERTIGGAVGFGATWIGPGVSMLTSPADTVKQFAFDIGEMDGSLNPRLERVKEILGLAGGCHILTNLMGIRWTKLLMNATFSGMSAALGCTFGDVLNDERAMVCVAHIADETIKVARASGYRLVKMQGVDFEFLELKDSGDIPGKMDFYRKVWGPHGKLKASMLQDLEKGRKTEIDYINGMVCKKGREFGLPTPYDDMVVELVKEAEARGVVPDLETNIKRFDL